MSRGKVRNAKATGLSRNSFSKKQHRDALPDADSARIEGRVVSISVQIDYAKDKH
ncbi:MAG: hypothetical protein V7609_217 [Verrucomicrobiota bacterium]